jgi:putative methanogenesis marker protein 8
MPDGQDEHILEAIGRCRVVIRDGKVAEVGAGLVTACPLAKRFACPVPEITPEAVRENIEHRIHGWGMCTPGREVLGTGEFVGFGASEIISFGLHAGLVDAAVMACDGAGTVVVTSPALAQGVGGRMSGLVKTTPYPEVIRRIEENGGIVVDKAGARLDQMAGVGIAFGRGYRNVVVTVALPAEAKAIREKYPDAIIFGVHVTGLTKDEAGILVGVADIVTACASRTIREAVGKRALVQAGVTIPIFALTPRAKCLIIEKIRAGNEPVVIKPSALPALGDKQPEPLV